MHRVSVEVRVMARLQAHDWPGTRRVLAVRLGISERTPSRHVKAQGLA